MRWSRRVRGAVARSGMPHSPAREAEAGLTSGWFEEGALQSLPSRYSSRESQPISYATVRDFADSLDHLHRLATTQGDLKDVQRPWALKTILSRVPPGSRLLEIGAGQPYVADILASLGYEVWLVDPYDGSGNGPVGFERYRLRRPARPTYHTSL